MAARDLLSLNKSMAPRLIRCLYMVAMVLIAVGTILGLMRGVTVMTRTPPPRPAVAANVTPTPDATQTPPGPGMMNQGPRGAMMTLGQRAAMMGQRAYMMGGRPMMMRRFGPIAPFGIARNPVGAGLWIIFGALLRGAVALLVVRILAEMGLAILAMPRRSET